MTAAAFNPEKILRDLHDLWGKLGSDQSTPGGVIRACAMTLIAVVDDEAAALEVRRILGDVMHRHPSRAIILRLSDAPDPVSSVFAECWKSPGAQSQICAEGIDLTAPASDPAAAAKMILPLLVADLPVVLWYFRGFARHDALLHLAKKVIVDSNSGSIADVLALQSNGIRVADLAWTRLTAWREAVANAFACRKPDAAAMNSIRIECGEPVSTSAQYFARWMERALPSAKVMTEAKAGEPGLHAVEFADVSLRRACAGSLEVRAGDCSSYSSLPEATDASLLSEELSIATADTVFDTVLHSF